MLCFIRGRWCPFCVAQTEAMNVVLPAIEEASATLAAVSPQTGRYAIKGHMFILTKLPKR